jgi:hypothetical protein
LLQSQNIGFNLCQGTQGFKLVKILGEVDLVTGFGLAFIDPGVGQVGADLAFKIVFDALRDQFFMWIVSIFYQEGDVFIVPQCGIRLGFASPGGDDMSVFILLLRRGHVLNSFPDRWRAFWGISASTATASGEASSSKSKICARRPWPQASFTTRPPRNFLLNWRATSVIGICF